MIFKLVGIIFFIALIGALMPIIHTAVLDNKVKKIKNVIKPGSYPKDMIEK